MRRQSISEELDSLHRQFLVESIMVPTGQLFRANSYGEASKRFKDFDNVACPVAGEPKGYLSKGDDRIHPIQKADLLSSGTSLLDLVMLLDTKPFYFVLHGNRIAGYVHFSDLNHNYVRIPVFGLLQLLEQAVWHKIEKRITPAAIRHAAPKRFKKIMAHRERNVSHNVDLGWSNVLYFPEIMALGVRLAKIVLSDTELKMFRTVRNAVAHPHGTLVRDKHDTAELAYVCAMAQSMIASA